MYGLTPREWRVLQLRYGINEQGVPGQNHQLLYREMIPLFGITQARIRQIEEKAIRKLLRLLLERTR